MKNIPILIIVKIVKIQLIILPIIILTKITLRIIMKELLNSPKKKGRPKKVPGALAESPKSPPAQVLRRSERKK